MKTKTGRKNVTRRQRRGMLWIAIEAIRARESGLDQIASCCACLADA